MDNKKCLMPEIPYCPACKYGYIEHFEDDESRTEWHCLAPDVVDVECCNLDYCELNDDGHCMLDSICPHQYMYGGMKCNVNIKVLNVII